jgi:hypothetical protein
VPECSTWALEPQQGRWHAALVLDNKVRPHERLYQTRNTGGLHRRSLARVLPPGGFLPLLGAVFVDSIDRRMASFVDWHGQVPPEAKLLEDFEAREHAASWIRRNIGTGIVHSNVTGYQLGDCWWTLFSEHAESRYPPPVGAERWHIEAYDHNGQSWIGNYYYWPAENRWRHVFYQRYGEDYGRYHGPGG